MTFPRRLLTLAVLAGLAHSGAAQELPPDQRARIDSVAAAVLRSTGAPSASVAVVRNGEVAYLQAYGEARPGRAARPGMRYAIGSVSKQFTAAALLLLAEEGKLSLDDPVSRWFPALTRAGDVTVRQLLSMRSGYQDYWPHDYVFTAMLSPTTTAAIMERWAGMALDFEPGSSWQYSNTNYIIAGSIVERVSGEPLLAFLRRRIFQPLGMTTVADYDAGPLAPEDAGAYLRHAMGPLREAPKEGPRWLFGTGQLAMTGRDLATWNISLMRQSLLSAASYRELQASGVLTTGTATGYGLGLNVGMAGGRRRFSHGGAVSGYTTSNFVYPDDRIAVTVFTNIYPGGGGASGQIASRVASIVLPPLDTTTSQWLALARRTYEGLARGTVDRSQLTPNAAAFFTNEVLRDYASSLGSLPAPSEFSDQGSQVRGGLRIRWYRVVTGTVELGITMMVMPDGKIEQFIVEKN